MDGKVLLLEGDCVKGSTIQQSWTMLLRERLVGTKLPLEGGAAEGYHAGRGPPAQHVACCQLLEVPGMLVFALQAWGEEAGRQRE